MNGGYYNNGFKEWYTRDEWGKRIYYGDQNYNYQGIINYFEAIKNGSEITEVLKKNFRRDVVKYAKDFVYPTYNPTKKWGDEMLNAYNGSTNYFDSLVK